MTEQAVGVIKPQGQHYKLILERRYPVVIDSVWRALIEPEKLRQWLGDVVIDGRVGGSFEIDFNGVDRAGGRILAYDPPNTLEFEWGEMGEASIVRFDLRQENGGTHLRLTHSLQSERMASGTGPGWHAHLDLFEAQLVGEDVEWKTAYEAAVPRYEGSLRGERSPRIGGDV